MTIDPEELNELARFNPRGLLVASLYLNVDGRRFTKRGYLAVFRDEAREARIRLDQRDLSDDARRSLDQDLDRLEAFLDHEYQRDGARGLVVYACHGVGFWRAYSFPLSVKTNLVIDHTPYVRPLHALLEDYPRFCVALVDREKARLFELFLGEIEEIATIQSEVPDQVRAGGFEGYEEKRIARHIEDHLLRHLKAVAGSLEDLNRRRRFHRLILAGNREVVGALEDLLPSSLKGKIVERMGMDLHLSESEIRKQTLSVAERVEREGEERLVEQLLNQLGPTGQGVVGLDDVLGLLRRGQVHLLLLEEGLVVPGVFCPNCRFLGMNQSRCPYCRSETEESPDIIEEAVDEAIRQGARVRQVGTETSLEGRGGVGAFLRYKI